MKNITGARSLKAIFELHRGCLFFKIYNFIKFHKLRSHKKDNVRLILDAKASYFSKNLSYATQQQVADITGLTIRTVAEHWNVVPPEFEEVRKQYQHRAGEFIELLLQVANETKDYKAIKEALKLLGYTEKQETVHTGAMPVQFTEEDASPDNSI